MSIEKRQERHDCFPYPRGLQRPCATPATQRIIHCAALTMRTVWRFVTSSARMTACPAARMNWASPVRPALALPAGPEPTLPGRLPCSPLFTGVSERGARNPFIDAGFRERAVIPLLLPSSLAVARIITARIVAERNAETRTAGAARDAGSIGSARDRGRAYRRACVRAGRPVLPWSARRVRRAGRFSRAPARRGSDASS